MVHQIQGDPRLLHCQWQPSLSDICWQCNRLAFAATLIVLSTVEIVGTFIFVFRPSDCPSPFLYVTLTPTV